MCKPIGLLASLLFASTPALATIFSVGIGDDCPTTSSRGVGGACFSPTPLKIAIGDSVTFYSYADTVDTGPHNVVADDGSFRCALGCVDQGGDGTPLDYSTFPWAFVRTFNAPGTVQYHDEVSHATGVIVVAGTNHVVEIGDDCSITESCFLPNPLTINVGDTVTFHAYIDLVDTGPHNVVADDGSFRCAAGCDDEGGNGAPTEGLNFARTFNMPGIVNYHDQVSHAAGVIIVEGTSAFAIGPGITGSWYDPAQSGHGLVVEVLSENRFYANWFAFNPGGTEQSWFSGVGTYSGNTATITDVEQPTGGRWIPNFDPTQIVRNAWGTLTFTFTDCNHGTVNFISVAGYGTGSMNLTRLTQPAGLPCP